MNFFLGGFNGYTGYGDFPNLILGIILIDYLNLISYNQILSVLGI